MRQLTEHDALFLFADNASSNSNITLIHIYDQTTAPGGIVRFKDILAHVESRLDRLPLFRQKLKRVPLDVDLPYWIDDEHFSLEYHVRHIALPKPGDWRQFCIQASRIHARSLDMQRPLWEMYVIEGLDCFLDLPPGSFAVLLKLHHCAVDVEHGNEITTLLHDLSPKPAPAAPVAPWFPEAAPSDADLLGKALLNSIATPFRLPTQMARFASYAPKVRTFLNDLAKSTDEMPSTRFNAVVSPHRVFDTRRFALDEFRSIRGLVDEATINDVVLAVCSGGLRRYLELQGELPTATLTAATPVSVRGETSESATNYEWEVVELHTEIEDPVERLIAIRGKTAASATMARGIAAAELTDIERHAPATTLTQTSKMLQRAKSQHGVWAPLANCTVTNVPGPAVPLYLRGARMTYFSAIMPISDGMGLVYAVTSYDGKVVVSFTGCYEQLPDPEVFAQCVRDSFQEYLAVARQQESGTAPKAAKTKARGAKKPAGKRQRDEAATAP